MAIVIKIAYLSLGHIIDHNDIFVTCRVSDNSRLRNVLTLNRTIPEAVISEDEEVCFNH